MRVVLPAAILLMLTGICACSTLNPEPCSQAWFEMEAKDAFANFRRDARPALEDIRRIARKAEGRDGLSSAEFGSALVAIGSLLNSLVENVLPRLTKAAESCGDTEFPRRAIAEFFKEEEIGSFAPLLEALARLFPVRGN